MARRKKKNGLDLSKPFPQELREPVARLLFRRSKRDGSCLVWGGCVRNGTHGAIKVKQTLLFVHRVAYVLAKGPIEKGLVVMHLCDNPLCVLPDHLSLGTPLENIADMVAKGRHKPVIENLRNRK